MSQCNKCSDKKCTPSSCGAPACDKPQSTSTTCAPAVCNYKPCQEKTTLRTMCNLDNCATLEERAKRLAMYKDQNNANGGGVNGELNDMNTDFFDDGGVEKERTEGEENANSEVCEKDEMNEGADGTGANSKVGDRGLCDCKCIQESATCTEVCTKCGKCKGVVIPNNIYGNSDK